MCFAHAIRSISLLEEAEKKHTTKGSYDEEIRKALNLIIAFLTDTHNSFNHKRLTVDPK